MIIVLSLHSNKLWHDQISYRIKEPAHIDGSKWLPRYFSLLYQWTRGNIYKQMMPNTGLQITNYIFPQLYPKKQEYINSYFCFTIFQKILQEKLKIQILHTWYNNIMGTENDCCEEKITGTGRVKRIRKLMIDERIMNCFSAGG